MQTPPHLHPLLLPRAVQVQMNLGQLRHWDKDDGEQRACMIGEAWTMARETLKQKAGLVEGGVANHTHLHCSGRVGQAKAKLCTGLPAGGRACMMSSLGCQPNFSGSFSRSFRRSSGTARKWVMCVCGWVWRGNSGALWFRHD